MRVTDRIEFFRIIKDKRKFIEMQIPNHAPFRVEVTKTGAVILFSSALSANLPFYVDDDCLDGWGKDVVAMGIGIPGQPHPPGSPFRDGVKEVQDKYPETAFRLNTYEPAMFCPHPPGRKMCDDIVEIFHRNGYMDVEYDGFGVNFIY